MKKVVSAVISVFVFVAVFFSDGILALAEQSDALRNVVQLETGIVNPPTLIARIATESDFNTLAAAETAPQVAVFSLDGNLNVTVDKVAKTIQEVSDACVHTIPLFMVEDEQTAVKAVKFAEENKIKDIMLGSYSQAAVKAVTDQRKHYVTGVYFTKDYKGAESLPDIVNATHICNAGLLVISGDMALTKKDAEYLQKRLVRVWLDYKTGTTEYKVSQAVDCGADGVFVEDLAAAKALYATVTEPTLIRRSFVTAHRGALKFAPENSIESMKFAIANNVDAIELDVRITSDGVPIIFHDESVEKLMKFNSEVKLASKKIKDNTYETLSKLKLEAVGEYTECKIPTLDDYLNAFVGLKSDAILYVELKTGEEDVVKKTVELIKKYKLESKAVFISFSTEVYPLLRQLCPESARSYLVSKETEQQYSSIFSEVAFMDTVGLSLSYKGVSEQLIKDCFLRGKSLATWTLNDEEMFKARISQGLSALTTDCSAEFANNLALRQSREITAANLFGAISAESSKAARVALPENIADYKTVAELSEQKIYLASLTTSVFSKDIALSIKTGDEVECESLIKKLEKSEISVVKKYDIAVLAEETPVSLIGNQIMTLPLPKGINPDNIGVFSLNVLGELVYHKSSVDSENQTISFDPSRTGVFVFGDLSKLKEKEEYSSIIGEEPESEQIVESSSQATSSAKKPQTVSKDNKGEQSGSAMIYVVVAALVLLLATGAWIFVKHR